MLKLCHLPFSTQLKSSNKSISSAVDFQYQTMFVGSADFATGTLLSAVTSPTSRCRTSSKTSFTKIEKMSTLRSSSSTGNKSARYSSKYTFSSLRAEPDLEFEGLLKRQHTRVKYFQGSLMNAMDLERAKVSAATSLEKAPQRPTLWLSLTRVMHSSIKSHPSQRNFHQTVNVCYELEIVEPATYLSPKSLFFKNSEALWISTPLFLCNPPVLTSRGLICTCKFSGVLISSH